MDSIFLIKLEAAAGALAIGAASLALLAPKGETLHVTAGRSFLALLALFCLATIVQATATSDTFALILAFFALYFAEAGWRWAAAAGFSRLDRALTGAMLTGSLAMAATAIACLAGGYTVTVSRETAPIVGLFGVIGAWAARRNLLDFERNLDWRARLTRHGAHMATAFILAATGFTTANGEKLGLSPSIAMVLPLLVIAPFGAFQLIRFRQGKGRTV